MRSIHCGVDQVKLPRPRAALSRWRSRHGDESGQDRRRRADRGQSVRDWLLVVALIIFVITGYKSVTDSTNASNKATAAAKAVKTEVSNRGAQRTGDLRARCRLESRRTAQDVNLNWVYYQSERKLSSNNGSADEFRQALASLSRGERTFLALLLKSGQPSAKVLQVRARADYDAAKAKTQTVDFRDAHLVARSTPLGSAEKPYEWVVKAHYSCDKAFQ